MANEITVHILTLNCWGIPFVSKNRLARMNAIADELVKGKYDVVCLQEVWYIKDFQMIAMKTKQQFPYTHYFFSGVVGSGICILSRFPIQDVMFHRWALNGYAHKIQHGDWFGGKGVGLCRLKVENMNVHVYVAHLHAEYCRENDEYIAHRVLQAFDTAQFIRITRGGADAVILGGDLNTEPQDLAYRIICGVAGLADACSSSLNGLGTSECANNSYTSSTSARILPKGRRIDHILYLGSNNFKVEAANFQHPFPARVPQKNFSYSDHEAVMATFKLSEGVNNTTIFDVKDSLKESIIICESALKRIRRHRIWYLLASCVLFVPLVWSMGIDYTVTSFGAIIGLNLFRIFLTAVLCYALFMSSIWNNVETNALKAGCLAMEVHLNQLSNGDNRRFMT